MSAQEDGFTAGLSDDEARARLLRDGPNRLPQARRRSLARIALGVATQPMILLLLATTLAYAALGSATDAIGLVVSVLLIGVIAVYQQQRTERVLESLRELSSPRSRVMRSGHVQRIASQDLVRGDLLLLAEGDRLACDAVILRCHSLLLDESLLTGESAPVLKQAASDPAQPATDDQRVRAGTLVVQGDGAAVVDATGAHTALGRIGSSLAQIVPRGSRVQAELKRVVSGVAIAAVIICLAAAALYAARQGSWIDGLLVGLTLAMSLIPEEFAVVWTVLMALGAWRLAQRQVLTRQPQAIEALGTTTVLAVDKTGTLTVNRMALLALALPDQRIDLAPGAAAPPAFAPLLDVAARASIDDGIEPMDRAIARLRERSCAHALPAATLVQRLGVAPDRLYVAHWWRDALGAGRLAVKGAPEAVLPLCALDATSLAAAQAAAAAMAGQGLRVLAVAEAAWAANAAPPDLSIPPLRWCGLLGFLDPLRADVPEAMAQCRAAGIRVVMITGDAPLTALAIARHAGLHDGDAPSVLAGTDVAALDDAAAVRAADIGVAMGQRGTDVAREAAALVLLDDGFASLVAAVRMGRRIFLNLKKSVGYLLAVHVPIVGVAMIPVVVGGPQLLLPLHVVFLELLIDPACSLVFEAEPEPADCMQQPPRAAGVGLLSWAALAQALAIGGIGLAAVVAVQLGVRGAGWSDDWSRAAALGSVIATNLAMLVWFRTGRQSLRQHAGNRAFAWLLAGLAAACGVVLSVAPLTRTFGLPVEPAVQSAGWLLMATAALAVLGLGWQRRS